MSDEWDMDIIGIALGGMHAAEQAVDTTARRLAGGTENAAPSDSLDLSADMTALMEAKTQFEVSARVAATAGEMQKQTIDLLA
jgi:hypothetical protein